MSTTRISKSSLPFHPFLFLTVPLLVLFRGNLNQLYPEDLALPLLLLFIPIVSLTVGFYFFFKSFTKSGLFVSLIILLFFSYGHIFQVLNGTFINLQISHTFFVIPFFVILILGFFYCLKTTRKLNNITTILNVVTIALIGVLLAQLVGYDFNPNYIFDDDIDTSIELNLAEGLNQYPDIYYIILDEYAGSKVLSETYNYENNEFINFLSNNGFSTPQETQSNYVVSFLSLSSALNMQYVNFFTDEVGNNSKDRRLSYNLLHENRVMQILESNGYSTFNVDSNWGPTNALRIADQNICETNPVFNSELLVTMLTTSMLKPILTDLFLPADRERVLCIFSEIPEIHSKSDKPIFLFAHIMLPHGPYVWGPNGEHKKIDSLNVLDIVEDKQGYLDQVKFTNKMIQEMIERIIYENKKSKIIIIQSDHGAVMPMNWENPTEKMQYDRLSNINYILVKEEYRNSLYDAMTPVNVFRVIFNSYFDTNFDVLDDRIFFSGYSKPYDFVDVTHLFR